MSQWINESNLAWCWAWMRQLGERFDDAVDEVWEPFMEPEFG